MTSAPTQTWNPADYHKHARFVSDLGMPVVELLAPKAGERILDLGCGDGALTLKLAQMGCTVKAVDASPHMVAAAQKLGLDAEVADGHALAFEAAFDAVFSNAALHWMQQPEAVIAGVWRALRPGGRFVAEMGGHGNVASIVQALEAALQARGLPAHNPWFFPTPEQYRALLEAQGFAVQHMQLLPRPTPLPGDVGAWIETLAQPFLADVPQAERPQLLAEVVNALRPVLCDAHGNWHADYVRLRFAATKPPTA
ncbi:MAG: methyltransferase domain-containing protein [Brachymonas sp.]|nr:methyltransferase domain-containing protein [Brachymonas sp.]